VIGRRLGACKKNQCGGMYASHGQTSAEDFSCQPMVGSLNPWRRLKGYLFSFFPPFLFGTLNLLTTYYGADPLNENAPTLFILAILPPSFSNSNESTS